MSIKRDNKSGTTGILDGLKIKKEETREIDSSSALVTNVDPESINDSDVENTSNLEVKVDEVITSSDDIDAAVALDPTPDINIKDTKDIIEQAKELMAGTNQSTRRTFTIDSLSQTQLNELKLYILPVVTNEKKWGYNEIVNLAIKDFYENQKKLLQKKLQK